MKEMTNVSLSVLRWADYPRMPWKNGLGSTHEVAAAPAGSGLPDFDWRVSIADVGAEGPFSSFPGVDRVITLIEGPSMVLTVDGTEHRLAPLTPFEFSGASTVSCRLPDGPTRDLNVMTRRGRAQGSLAVVDVRTTRDIAVSPDETLLVLALTGQLTLSPAGPGAGSGSGEVALERLDAVQQEGRGSLRIRGRGSVAEIRIGFL